MEQKDIQHLLNRTSFGFNNEDLKRYEHFTKEEAVNDLLDLANSSSTIKLPSDFSKNRVRPENYKNFTREEKQIIRKFKKEKIQDLRVWWYKMMLEHNYSFREKMTLFWHNHFTSSFQTVKNHYYMYQQNQMFRENALGDFTVMLNQITKDLAMLIYLDNNSNKKNNPNENFGRELLELFTLGEGKYTEDDVKNSSKAFTGWRIQKKKGKFKKAKRLHDFGKKIFLHQTGNFDGEDIITIILQQDATSEFITTKIYKEFILDELDHEFIKKTAKKFKDSNYDIKILMKTILLSDQFWNSKQLQIKSPSELIVSLLKETNLPLNENIFKYILKSSKKLGQELFDPPNVKGWAGGKLWIDTNTLLLRKSFIRRIVARELNKKEYLTYYQSSMFQLK